VILNLNHSNLVPDVLGRYRNNPDRDTLSLDLLQQGMACRCSLPHTSNANDTLELMRRGDIDGMSFAFSDDSHDRESVSYERTEELHDGKEVWIRRVKRATGFFDVSIVTHPAYGQTSVATREFGEEILRQIDEQIEAHKREQEATDDEANAAEDEAKRKEQEAKEAREQAEQEQREREAVAAIRMRRNRIALMNRDLEDFYV
jgi:HK97 family phage prohead protease